MANAKKVVNALKAGEVQYDFVEVMACPFGCCGGGGQPKGAKEVVQERMNVIYELDRNLPIRRSHENPIVIKLYERFLGTYGSKKAHELLHINPFYGENQNETPERSSP